MQLDLGRAVGDVEVAGGITRSEALAGCAGCREGAAVDRDAVRRIQTVASLAVAGRAEGAGAERHAVCINACGLTLEGEAAVKGHILCGIEAVVSVGGGRGVAALDGQVFDSREESIGLAVGHGEYFADGGVIEGEGVGGRIKFRLAAVLEDVVLVAVGNGGAADREAVGFDRLGGLRGRCRFGGPGALLYNGNAPGDSVVVMAVDDDIVVVSTDRRLRQARIVRLAEIGLIAEFHSISRQERIDLCLYVHLGDAVADDDLAVLGKYADVFGAVGGEGA